MEAVARLLLMEAGVVDGPFFLGGRADIGINTLGIFVEGNEASRYGRGKACGNTRTVHSSAGLLVRAIESGWDMLEGAFVAEAAKALIALAEMP